MKSPIAWNANPSAEESEYSYNSTSQNYNSTTLNYSGVVDGDTAIAEEAPTLWEVMPA